MRLSKRVFLKQKEELKRKFLFSDTDIENMIKGNHDDALSKVVGNLLASKLASPDPGSTLVMDNSIIDMFDELWYYKRRTHLVLNSIPKIDTILGVDTTGLSKLDNDIILDTYINGVESSIILSHREAPLVVKSTSYCWSILVYTSDNAHPNFEFTFGESEKTMKVYMHSFQYTLCNNCNGCESIEQAYNNSLKRRPMVRPNCKIDASLAAPIEILGIMMYVVNTYVNREKIARQRKNPTYKESLKSIMVEHEDTDEDTARLLPLFQYVKEYRESQPYEYRGGHHKSPVSHLRSGYFRRSRTGDYILVDGEFKKVAKGLGQYTYVKPTLVNANKDSVTYSII